MTVKTTISFKAYCKLLFGLTYKRPILKIIVGAGFAMIVWIGGYYLHFIPVPKPQIYQYITLALVAVIQPAVIYWTIKRNYDSSNHLGEQLEINITPNEINIRGESFYTELNWNKLYKVDEQANYFLIYQNNLSAIIISKKDLSATQLQELRSILKSIPPVPVHLQETD